MDHKAEDLGIASTQDIANIALVHRDECVPVDRPSSARCEAESYVGGTPCPNRADYKFGIGGGWSYICYNHYQGLPDATGCGCLVCTDQA